MNSFQLSGLPEQEFSPLFELTNAELAHRHIQRVIADTSFGYPCRISLVDAEPGDELLLLAHAHQPEDSPYRASGPIYVRRHAKRNVLPVGKLPEYVTRRLISLRAYSADHRMVSADVCDGGDLSPRILQAFENPEIAYLHLHNAKQGCYSCRVDHVRREDDSMLLTSGG